MKTIELTQGKVALVDDEDYDFLSKYKWKAHKSRGSRTCFYADRDFGSTRSDRKTVSMHSLILGVVDGKEIDHIDGDGLNNRKSNLRHCSRAENCRNVRRGSIKGVHIDKRKLLRKYMAKITSNGKTTFLGMFSTAAEAGMAYNEAAKKLHGEFASINRL